MTIGQRITELAADAHKLAVIIKRPVYWESEKESVVNPFDIPSGMLPSASGVITGNAEMLVERLASGDDVRDCIVQLYGAVVVAFKVADEVARSRYPQPSGETLAHATEIRDLARRLHEECGDLIVDIMREPTPVEEPRP